MPRQVLVSQVMTTDVVTFTADEKVEDATRRLLDRGVDGAPVVDDDGRILRAMTATQLP